MDGWFDIYTPSTVVVSDKFIWDTDEHSTFTNGECTIITGTPPEYNIKLCDINGNARWFTVSSYEYEQLEIGTFLSALNRNPLFTDYNYIVLDKYKYLFDYDSHGKILNLVIKQEIGDAIIK